MIKNSYHVHQFKAGPMDNFLYLIEDLHTNACLIVDPAWDLQALESVIASKGLSLEGVLLTHGHGDHLNMLDWVLALKTVPVWMSPLEHADFIPKETALTWTEDGQLLPFGKGAGIQVLHTPGHSPGSQCFLLEGSLIAGDTLFIDGAGNCRLDGADAEALYESLHTRLWPLPDDTLIYPGHDYGHAACDTLGNQKKRNPYLLLPDKAKFVERRLR